MIPFTFKDFKQLTNCLPSECDSIDMTVGSQLIDRVTCTKEDDGWHIDLQYIQEE